MGNESALRGNKYEPFGVVGICGIPFPLIDYALAIERFGQWIESGKPHQVCVANVHTVVSSLADERLRKVNNDAAMVTMDGQPLKWYANLVHGARLKDRVCGPELMLRCFDEGQTKGWRHFLYGGRADVLDELKSNLSNRFPSARIVGSISPPFRALREDELEEIVQTINESRADFLWVGLGAPKQEYFIHDNLGVIKTPVQIGVGAAFDFHAGAIKRAPAILQKLGLEWFFRMLQDPRLFWRYASTNPRFMSLLLRDWARSRSERRS